MIDAIWNTRPNRFARDGFVYICNWCGIMARDVKGTQLLVKDFPGEWKRDCCYFRAIEVPEYILIVQQERVVAMDWSRRPVLWTEEATTTGKGKKKLP